MQWIKEEYRAESNGTKNSKKIANIQQIGCAIRIYYNTMHGLGFVQPNKSEWSLSSKMKRFLPLDLVKKIAVLAAQKEIL